MTYPIGTPVHTFLLDGAVEGDDNVVATNVVVYIGDDGQVVLSQHDHYRDAQSFCRIVEDQGGRVLAVVEGERDLSTGTASVWSQS